MSQSEAAQLRGGVDYEQIARRYAPVHDQLVERLGAQPGENWLDVGTGTGEVAIRAAAGGAHVTGVDIEPRMIELARAKAPQIPFEVGDVQALPYEAESFDVLGSCFGFIFAPDHGATAREIARVCRDRLGFTSWEPQPAVRDLYARFGLDAPEGPLTFEWGRSEHVHELLGAFFDLEIERDSWYLDAADGEELWQFWTTVAARFKAMVAELDDETRDAFHAAYVEYFESYREGEVVRVPRPYLLVLGKRR